MATTYYAVVRKTEGKEWVDGESIALLPEMTRNIVEETKEKIPYWNKENPPIRLVKLVLTEVETLEEF